jgi:hypothetical protein
MFMINRVYSEELGCLSVRMFQLEYHWISLLRHTITRVRVIVNLRLAVYSQSVRLADKHLETLDQ